MLINRLSQKTQIGDCEVCDLVNINVTFMHGNTWMCDTHRDEELRVMNAAESSKTRLESAQSLIGLSQKIDQSIQLVTDIANAKTIPMQELRASILQDESIPQDEKEFVFAVECEKKVSHLTQVIFDKMKSLGEDQQEKRMWQVNGQMSVGKLHAEKRERFKLFDNTYQPTPVVISKVRSTSNKPTKTFDKAALHEAASKYGVSASDVQMAVVSRDIKPENAAKSLLTAICKRYDVDVHAVHSAVMQRKISGEDAAKELAKMLGKLK